MKHSTLGNIMESVSLDTRIIELSNQIMELEAAQTRWVKCSERMPHKPGQYFILEKSHTTTGMRLGVAMGKTEGWLTHDRDDVVAWLDNVPKYEP